MPSSNSLSQKIVALAIDRLERHFANTHDQQDAAGRIITTALSRTRPDIRTAITRNLKLFRSTPVSHQERFMGKYYNRHIVLSDVAANVATTSAMPSAYEVYERPLSSMRHDSVVDKRIALADWLRTHTPAVYRSISLELDRINIIDEGDWGDAEAIVIGGASDGIKAHAIVSHVRRGGDDSDILFFGEDRIAVPLWDLEEDGTSKISYYGEVWELDAHDRADIIALVGGAAGLATAIVSGLVAGGVIGGPAGAIAGAVIGAIVGIIEIFAALNSDDFWGSHQIELFGPYEVPQQNPLRITQERRPDGEHYALHFIRHLYEHVPKPDVNYTVLVTTANREDAGTDANVYLTIHGCDGDAGEFALNNMNRDDFERGHTDDFAITAPDLGDLKSIHVRHDNSGEKPGWFLSQVNIRNNDNGREWLFSANRWLARDEADRKTECDVYAG